VMHAYIMPKSVGNHRQELSETYELHTHSKQQLSVLQGLI
jgi:hypothetical protein